MQIREVESELELSTFC